MKITRPAYMEINISNLEYNISQIKNKIGKEVKIMPVIKASGYGTHINERLEILEKFDIVAVANVDEAVFIRKLGYSKEIFVLNQPYDDEIEKIVKYNIVVGISSYEFAEKLGTTKKNITVHVEIGTGMGRTGVHPYKIENFLQYLPKNIIVEGIYTHFSSADFDDKYTKQQLKSFKNGQKSILGELRRSV